jgi:nucleotide-binding universal stress UspA family protein
MMSMKTILVPMESHDVQPALETALLLARRCESYIEGFALRWEELSAFGVDLMDDMALEKYKQDIAQGAWRARQNFEAFMRKNDVPHSTKTTVSLSFGWLDDVPEGASFVGSYGRVFDIIVMNRPDGNSPGLYNRAIESGLFESGRPILLSPPSPPRQIGANVLVPWNSSTEQARTIALAMPLLQQADSITVLTVVDGSGVPGPSAEQLIRYLQRNSITTKQRTVELGGRSTGEAILATAESLGCDLLIKGAYTQSRLRQIIFGGATQHVLANAALPVLLAH